MRPETLQETVDPTGERAALRAPDVGRLRLLAIARIAWAPMWLLQLCVWAQSNLGLAHYMPSSAWMPVGPGYLMPSPAPMFVSALWVAAFVATVLLGLGLWTRVSGAATLATALVLGPIALGWGKIGHGSQPLVLFLLVFLFTPWGAAWSLDARRARRQGKPLPITGDGAYRVTMALTGLLYFSSGLLKLARGEFAQSGNISGFIVRQTIRYSDWYGVPTPGWSRELGTWVASHPALADLFGYSALLLELTILVGVLGPRTRVLSSGLQCLLLGGIAILAPLRFYMQAHVALLVGGATLVLLLRSRSPRLRRWFPPAPEAIPEAADFERRPQPIDWRLIGLVAAMGVVLRVLVQVWRSGGWIPVDDWTDGSLQVLYLLFSVEVMAVVTVLGLAGVAWALVAIARHAKATLGAPSDDGLQRTLLFDADCGFCQSWVGWAMDHEPKGVAFKACQLAPAVRVAGGLSEAHCSEAAFLVTTDPSGRTVDVRRGAGAIHGVHARFTRRAAGAWRLAAATYGLDGVRHLQDLGYAVVARNRHRLGDQSCPVPGQGRT